MGRGAGAQEGDEAGDPEEDIGRVQHLDLGVDEGKKRKHDVFVPDHAVVEEFEGWPAVVDLPEEVGQGDEDEERDGDGAPSGEEDAALGGEEEAEAEGDEEEGHGRLVEEAEAGGEAKDDPPFPRAGTGEDADDGECAGHPEEGFEGVHGEEAVDAEELGGDEDAEHSQGLRGAAATERPGEDAGEKDDGCSGEVREETDAEDGGAEEGLREASLNGDQGAVIDVAPGEMSATHDVVELVTEVAVAEMLRPERGGDVQDQLDGGEREGEADGGGERGIGWADDGGAGRVGSNGGWHRSPIVYVR